jgi:hypothetical protein
MTFSEMQQAIIGRLDNRTDLAAIVNQYVYGRISYWSNYFFYSSDVIDTSLTTSGGVAFYNLPNNIRSIRKLRLMIPGAFQAYTQTTGGNISLPTATINVSTTQGFTPSGTLLIGGSQVVQYTGVTPNSFTGCTGGSGVVINGTGMTQMMPVTTTTSQVVLPVGTIPVVSTNGFTSSGVLSIAGTQVTYASQDPTDFLGAIGGAPQTVPSGTTVQQLYGIWIPLGKINYEAVLDADTLSPSNVALPSWYAQYGLQFRLYPVPDLGYPLEVTGSAAPAAPQNDGDINFWTDDSRDGAAWLIIASTTNEVRTGYLNGQANPADLALEERERRKLLKESSDLGDPKQVRMWL